MRNLLLLLLAFCIAHSIFAAESCPPGQRRLNDGEPCIPETLFNYLYCLSRSGGGKIELKYKDSSSTDKSLEVTIGGKASGVIIKGEGAVGVKQSEASQAARELNESLDPSLASKCESLSKIATSTGPPRPYKVNNNDAKIIYSGDCGYNHGLSALLYNDDVQICNRKGDSFTYTFTGQSIYLQTVYYKGQGGTISCYIDGSLTQSFNLDSSQGVDNYGFAYGVVLPIAPSLVYGQHTASCKMTSANTKFFVDALIVNK